MQLDLSNVAASASAQWPVFPCNPLSKAPIVQRGLYSASQDTGQVSRWWTQWPDAMIGVPTGARSGFWVLDVDVKGNGPAELDRLIREHGDLPVTFVVATASGGRHFYWKHVDGVRNRGQLSNGIDVRGEGGYVIAAGSVRSDGTFYEIDCDEPIAEAPQWLLDLVVRRQAQPIPAVNLPGPMIGGGDNPAYIEAAVNGEIDRLAATMAGRNNALNDASFALGTLVGAGAMSRGDAEARLFAAAVANGYVAKDGEASARATIRSGLSSGEASPRQIPAPRDRAAELDAWIPRKLIARITGGAINGRGDEPDAPDGPVIIPAQDAENTADILHATPFILGDPSKLPRRDFVYGTHLVRKYVSVTVSPGGIGKTSLSIAEALAMVTARPLLGTVVRKPLRVWLFNAEDPRDEMERRIAAACLYYGIGAADLAGRLFLDTGREQEFLIAKEDRNGFVYNVPILDAVVDQVARNGIDVSIFDPFVSTHRVNENDNGAIDKVAKTWGTIADLTNSAIELIHHVRKAEGREVGIDDARGAGSLMAAARSARVLNRMSEEQASAAGVNARDRMAYFSVSRGKANLAPLSLEVEWRQLVSVGLNNGSGLQDPMDHAGVVTQWQWPDSDEVVGAIDPDQLATILARIAGGDFRENEQASDWAGSVVAEVLGLEADDKGIRKRIKRMLSKWIADGVLSIDERRNAKREIKKFVVVPETAAP